jgi:hypothetical protein
MRYRVRSKKAGSAGQNRPFCIPAPDAGSLDHRARRLCVAVLPGVSCKEEAGQLWDVLCVLRLAIRGSKGDPGEIRFALHVRNDNREGTTPLVRLNAVCGPGDRGEQVVTVMMPGKD